MKRMDLLKGAWDAKQPGQGPFEGRTQRSAETGLPKNFRKLKKAGRHWRMLRNALKKANDKFEQQEEYEAPGSADEEDEGFGLLALDHLEEKGGNSVLASDLKIYNKKKT